MNANVMIATALWLAAAAACYGSGQPPIQKPDRPNFLVLLTDDQRADAMGCSGNPNVRTPHIDTLAGSGVRFTNAFVTTSICSPSRAALLTGRYGSTNGVTSLSGAPLNPGVPTWPRALKAAGYRTAVMGKWHLADTPRSVGFTEAVIFQGNGPYEGRQVMDHGVSRTIEGRTDEYIAGRTVAFLKSASTGQAPFALFLCTQAPHMDDRFRWPAKAETRQTYCAEKMPIPTSWEDDLNGKPPYLRTARQRSRAVQEYHYDRKAAVQRHLCDYYAAITEMDASLGHVFQALQALDLQRNTYVLFTSDNGWLMGEHRMTSKVLAYEESIRVPLIISGPDIRPGTDSRLVLNIDIAPTILALAGLKMPGQVQGRSMVPILNTTASQPGNDWRTHILYEAMAPELGSWPMLALRTARWKYIVTFEPGTQPAQPVFEELYDLSADPAEMTNLAQAPGYADTLRKMRADLTRERPEVFEGRAPPGDKPGDHP